MQERLRRTGTAGPQLPAALPGVLPASEEHLRRLIGRLCTAAQGRDERLDRCLAELGAVARRPLDSDDVDALLAELSTAIAGLDAASTRAGAAAAELPLAELLGRLIDQLSLLPALQAQASALRQRLRSGEAQREPIKTVRQLATLINEQRSLLQQEKSEVERVLAQVTARLDEMAAHLNLEAQNEREAQDNTRELNTRLLGEVRELNSNARDALELSALQQQVRTRLEVIDGHLQVFREREEARLREQQERTARMKSRIDELERETHSLQQSVVDGQRLALTDSLTGIPNRLAYKLRAEETLARLRRFGHPLCIAVWDIDRFKSINDTYGHAAGDKVLQIVAKILARCIRQTDFVARYGGEEFVMLLDGAASAETMALADKLRQTVEGIGFRHREQAIAVTISCGVAAVEAGDSIESAFERADRALYEAKRSGRNRCVLA